MGLPLRDRDYHTYADYRGWPEDARHELIDGHAQAMAPAPSVSHQRVARELLNQLDAAPRGCEFFVVGAALAAITT